MISAQPLPPDLMDAIVAACREAGEIALGLFRPGAQTAARTWSKSGGSPVTEADIGVDTFLRLRLSELLPGTGWLSEETVDDAHRLSRHRGWVVDPIDGTRAYMGGSPDWAVCVALLEDNVPIAGVVHAPAGEGTYTAWRGSGAQLNGQTITANPVSGIGQARIAGPKPMLDALGRARPFTAVDKIPSLALRISRIAEGRIDAGLVSPDARDWDIAAADLILAEARGRLLQGDGAAVSYNRPTPTHGMLVASGEALMPPLLAAFGSMRRASSARSSG